MLKPLDLQYDQFFHLSQIVLSAQVGISYAHLTLWDAGNLPRKEANNHSIISFLDINLYNSNIVGKNKCLIRHICIDRFITFKGSV